MRKRTASLPAAMLMLALTTAACVPRLLSMMQGIEGGGTAWGSGAFGSNGERIYFSATNERGERIRYSGGPSLGGMMMGGELACDSCHGPDGRGGVHWMHMQKMQAPDIRWITLSSGEHGGHDEHQEEAQELPYDEDSFKQALREGITPSGDRLSWEMPRWEMSEADIGDLIAFLKALP